MNEDYFAKDKWHPAGHQPTQYQIYCWEYMKKHILNPIRRYVGVPVHLSNVIRLGSDYDRLLAAGYNPSETSDHYAGQHIRLKSGRVFADSIFAADAVFAGDMKGLCRDIYRQANNEIIPKISGLDCDAIGQLIYEGQLVKGKPVYWIHFGLAAEVVYSEGFAGILRSQRNKERWLEYRNGTYIKSRYES